MTDSLFDILTIQQIAHVLDRYSDVHGPWPININFTTPDGKRDTFKCCLYLQLHNMSLRSDTSDCYDYDDIGQGYDDRYSHYDDFCSTDLDPEI